MSFRVLVTIRPAFVINCSVRQLSGEEDDIARAQHIHRMFAPVLPGSKRERRKQEMAFAALVCCIGAGLVTAKYLGNALGLPSKK